ncbi:MAG: hypothetical protein N2971_05575 [Chlorobi bacterium]|nr:hypothetical protein [Chlorobiota bacterium]
MPSLPSVAMPSKVRWAARLVGAVCIAFVRTLAQNADMSGEPTSGDLLMLQVMLQERPIGTMSVLPPRLDDLLTRPTTLDTFQRYVAVYYAPVGDSTPMAFQLAQWHRGRFALGAMRDSVLAFRLDAAAYSRGGMLHERSADALAAGRLSVRALGQAGHWSFILDLANGAVFRGVPERIALTDPDMARAPRLFIDQRTFYDRAIGAIQYQGAFGRLRLGRDVIGWGYSPLGGGLLLSVGQPLLDHVLADVHYGVFRFSYLHAAAIGTDTAGASVPSKFLAAHRLQVDLTEDLSLAVSDAIVYSGRGLDLGYLNPLGFYVSSGMLSSERNANDNSLLMLDAAWRPLKGTLLYGALLADDIGFSTLGDTSVRGNNNKYAWQGGLAQLVRIGTAPLLLIGEYVRINPFVYAHRTMVNSWTSQGEVLGSLQQPNSDRWTIAATLWLAPRLRIAARADYLRWGENWLDSTGQIVTVLLPGTTIRVPVGNVGGDALRGDGDVLPEPFAVGNRFLRGNVSHTRRIELWCSLEPWTNVFLDVRATYTRRTGGNAPVDRWWWWIQLRLGY